MKIAAIDIGSNAIRMAVAEVKNEEYQIVRKLRVPLRLGDDAFGSKQMFSRSTIEMASEVFMSFSEVMQKENVDIYKAFATSAFRDAKNSADMAKAIQRTSKIVIEKMSGDQEAKLILGSVLSKIELGNKKDYLLADLGGGSLELSQIEDGKIAGSKSFNLGTVRLKNFIEDNKHAPKQIEQLIKTKQKEMLTFLDDKIKNSDDLSIIGTGGNFRRIVKMRDQICPSNKPFVTPKELETIYNNLAEMTFLQRIKEFELRPDRADVIIPALKIILGLVEILPVKKLFMPKVGLINGILRGIIQKEF